MQKQLPPGATRYKGKIKSHWREFEFMLHQVQQAIEPTIALDQTIDRWAEISKNLAESTRNRRLQLAEYHIS